jgi:hypothetical protein
MVPGFLVLLPFKSGLNASIAASMSSCCWPINVAWLISSLSLINEAISSHPFMDRSIVAKPKTVVKKTVPYVIGIASTQPPNPISQGASNI